MDTTSTALSATSTLANDTAAADAYSAAAAYNAAANNWVTVERELPSLTGPSASQPWQLAQGAAVQAALEAAAVPHFAGGPLGVPLSGGWSGASAVERTASRGGGGRHPWEVDSSQLCRSDEVHEVTLPDCSAGSGRKSGGCGCGGSCGGKCGGSRGQKPHRDPGMDGGARPAGHRTGRASGNPYVLDDPRHNLVLLAQELLLLEGHLADPERRCPSCVTKHALTARGLADEGRRLDGGGALGPVWSAVLGLGLGANAQAVRMVRQGVVGRIVGQSEAGSRPTSTPARRNTSLLALISEAETLLLRLGAGPRDVQLAVEAVERLRVASPHGRATSEARQHSGWRLVPGEPSTGDCTDDDKVAAVLVFLLVLLLTGSMDKAQQALQNLMDGCTQGAVDLPDNPGGGPGEGARSNRQYTPFLVPGKYQGKCPPPFTSSKDAACKVPGGPAVGANFCFLNCQDLAGQGQDAYILKWGGEGTAVDLKCEACSGSDQP